MLRQFLCSLFTRPQLRVGKSGAELFSSYTPNKILPGWPFSEGMPKGPTKLSLFEVLHHEGRVLQAEVQFDSLSNCLKWHTTEGDLFQAHVASWREVIL